MTAGDAYVVGPTSVADDAYLEFQPDPGSEIVVHNCYVPNGSAVELYWSNGSDDILIDSSTETFEDFHFHCTNAVFIRVKNVSGGAILLGGDGMYTAPEPA